MLCMGDRPSSSLPIFFLRCVMCVARLRSQDLGSRPSPILASSALPTTLPECWDNSFNSLNSMLVKFILLPRQVAAHFEAERRRLAWRCIGFIATIFGRRVRRRMERNRATSSRRLHDLHRKSSAPSSRATMTSISSLLALSITTGKSLWRRISRSASIPLDPGSRSLRMMRSQRPVIVTNNSATPPFSIVTLNPCSSR